MKTLYGFRRTPEEIPHLFISKVVGTYSECGRMRLDLGVLEVSLDTVERRGGRKPLVAPREFCFACCQRTSRAVGKRGPR